MSRPALRLVLADPTPELPAASIWTDPPFWSAGLPLTEQIARLAVLAPSQTQALQVLVESILRESYWQAARTQDGLRTLVTLAERP
jgi:hypothetical protein